MKLSTQRLFVWSGAVGLGLLLIGFLVADFVPPPSPAMSAEQVASFYASHADRIKLGLVVSMFGVAFLGPWVAMIAAHLQRMEGRVSPSALLQIGFGALLVIEFLVPMIMLEAAVFRPERSAESIQTLNDEGWIGIISVVSTAVIEVIALGLAVRNDRSGVFPAWLAPVSFGTGATFVGGGFCIYAKTGVIAWDGVFSWWFPLATFGGWILLMCVVMHQSVGRYFAEHPDGEPTVHAELAALRASVAALEGQARPYSAVSASRPR